MNRSVKSARNFQFIEKRYAPIWVLVTGLIFAFSLGIALLPRVGALYSVAVSVLIALIVSQFWRSAQSPIVLDEKTLRVGRARIETSWISNIDVLTPSQFLQRIRTDSLPTDYYSLRNLDYGGVVIQITDESDPYKHWVISMRNGQELKDVCHRGSNE